jgi:hypothetical protein
VTTRNREEPTLPMRLLPNPRVDRLDGVLQKDLTHAATASNIAYRDAYGRVLEENIFLRRLAWAAMVVAIAALVVSAANLYLTLRTFDMVQRANAAQGVLP